MLKENKEKLTAFFSMLKRNMFLQAILAYTGLVALILTWPAANIIIKNDSFRFVENWSLLPFSVFAFAYSLMPVFFLTAVDLILKKKSEKGKELFRCFIFCSGAFLFWMQLSAFHLVSAVRELRLVTNNFWLLMIFLAGGGLFTFFIFKLRKYIFSFLKYLSPLMVIALVLLFFTSFDSNIFFNSKDGKTPDFISQAEKEKKRIYVIIFDGVSLNFLMENEEINKELFPTFYQLSQEWTWYRNATTNGIPTLAGKTSLFSGRYYGVKKDSSSGYKDSLLKLADAAGDVYFFSSLPDPLGLDNRNTEKPSLSENILKAFWLNKVLFSSYVAASLPSLAETFINGRLLKSWSFDWRGEAPEEYIGKERIFFGNRIKKRFFNFIEKSGDISLKEQNGKFFLIWSMITHPPYIFSGNGDIHQLPFVEYRQGMAPEEAQKVADNYTEVLKYADKVLGLFIKNLEEKGLYEDSVILITSDHGMLRSIGGNDFDINDRAYRIPFFLKFSGIEKGINDRDVQSIDVLPTILDIIFGKVSSNYDGQSLLGPYEPRDKIMYVLGIPGFYIIENGKAVWHK